MNVQFLKYIRMTVQVKILNLFLTTSKIHLKFLYKRHIKRKLTKYLESKQLEKLRCNMFAEEKGNSIQETKEDFVASNF